MPYYKNRYNLEGNDLAETLKIYERTISLPIWPGMTEKQTDAVIAVVKKLGSEYNISS